MGRKLMRVPLSFSAPLKKVWDGYVNPHYKHCHTCAYCNGNGMNEATKKISDDWYGYNKPADWVYLDENMNRRYNRAAWHYNLDADDVQALLDADDLWDFTRVPINDEQKEIVRKKREEGGNSWLPFDNGYKPTVEEVNHYAIHNPMGLCGGSQWVCVKAKAQRLGVYGVCSTCNGEGSIWDSEEEKQLSETWKKTNPPRGRGFQLWETTSEGSPSSPVFRTLEALCEWCETNATTFADYTATKEEWMKMLDSNNVYHQEGNLIFI